MSLAVASRQALSLGFSLADLQRYQRDIQTIKH